VIGAAERLPYLIIHSQANLSVRRRPRDVICFTRSYNLWRPIQALLPQTNLINQLIAQQPASFSLTISPVGKGIVKGRAIAQAVSRWLPTAAARVRARVWSSGICGGQSGAGAGFLRVLRFPLPIFIPPNSPSS
jgi:hypothetical protein